MFKRIAGLIIVVCFLAGVALSQTTVSGGQVSGTWTAAGSPYEVEGNIWVLLINRSQLKQE